MSTRTTAENAAEAFISINIRNYLAQKSQFPSIHNYTFDGFSVIRVLEISITPKNDVNHFLSNIAEKSDFSLATNVIPISFTSLDFKPLTGFISFRALFEEPQNANSLLWNSIRFFERLEIKNSSIQGTLKMDSYTSSLRDAFDALITYSPSHSISSALYYAWNN